MSRYKTKLRNKGPGSNNCNCTPVNGEACHCGGSGLGSKEYGIWDTVKKKFTVHVFWPYIPGYGSKEDVMGKVRQLNVKERQK